MEEGNINYKEYNLSYDPPTSRFGEDGLNISCAKPIQIFVGCKIGKAMNFDSCLLVRYQQSRIFLCFRY